MHPSASWRKPRGYTLLEIMSVLVVIGILTTLLIPALEEVRMRMDKAACSNNLRQLYVASTAYIQDHGHWPQVNPTLLQGANHAYDEAWIEDLMPYGVGRKSWICPTTERDLGGPDYTQPENYRADYIAMPFDSKPLTPFKWAFDPWFVERGNVHGNGNLMIESNGAVVELSQLQATMTGKPASTP